MHFSVFRFSFCLSGGWWGGGRIRGRGRRRGAHTGDAVPWSTTGLGVLGVVGVTGVLRGSLVRELQHGAPGHGLRGVLVAVLRGKLPWWTIIVGLRGGTLPGGGDWVVRDVLHLVAGVAVEGGILHTVGLRGHGLRGPGAEVGLVVLLGGGHVVEGHGGPYHRRRAFVRLPRDRLWGEHLAIRGVAHKRDFLGSLPHWLHRLGACRGEGQEVVVVHRLEVVWVRGSELRLLRGCCLQRPLHRVSREVLTVAAVVREPRGLPLVLVACVLAALADGADTLRASLGVFGAPAPATCTRARGQRAPEHRHPDGCIRGLVCALQAGILHSRVVSWVNPL
eukprot:RCo036772